MTVFRFSRSTHQRGSQGNDSTSGDAYKDGAIISFVRVRLTSSCVNEALKIYQQKGGGKVDVVTNMYGLMPHQAVVLQTPGAVFPGLTSSSLYTSTPH